MFNSTKFTTDTQAENTLKPAVFQGFSRFKRRLLNVTLSLSIALLSRPAFAQNVIGGDQLTSLGNDFITTLFLVGQIVAAGALVVLAILFSVKQKPLGLTVGLGIAAAAIAFGPALLDRIYQDGASGFTVEQ